MALRLRSQGHEQKNLRNKMATKSTDETAGAQSGNACAQTGETVSSERSAAQS